MRACAGGAVVRLALVVVAMCVRVLMCVCVWMCWHARAWIKQHVHAHVGREEDNVVCGKAARIRCVCVPHGGERKSERARGHRRALEGERVGRRGLCWWRGGVNVRGAGGGEIVQSATHKRGRPKRKS